MFNGFIPRPVFSKMRRECWGDDRHYRFRHNPKRFETLSNLGFLSFDFYNDCNGHYEFESQEHHLALMLKYS